MMSIDATLQVVIQRAKLMDVEGDPTLYGIEGEPEPWTMDGQKVLAQVAEIMGIPFPITTDATYTCKTKTNNEEEKKSPALAVQPPPRYGHTDVVPMVLGDLMARSKMGELKYGKTLQTFNGRSALIDLYQELLDACCYLKQLLMEEEQMEEATLHGTCPKCKKILHILDHETNQCQECLCVLSQEI